MAFYANGTASFEHQDWLGTERLRTTYNGGVEGTYRSLPWGDGQSFSGSDQDAHHYATLDYDSESSTDHAQFRQYSSTEGRFLSPDPYGGSYNPANPQSFNRYEYAMDNPLSNIDPSGLDCQDGWYSADEEGDCFPGVPGYYNGGGGGGIGSNGMTGIEATDQWIPDVEVVGGHWVMDYNLNTGLTNMVWGGYYYVDFGYWAPIDGSNPGIGTLTSGGTGGGGGGGGGGAPNNGSQKPGFWSCTFTGNVGASWGETALDAVGIIPFGGNGVKGVQLASGIVAGSISAYKHSMTGAGLSAGGLVLTAAEDSGAKLALNGVEMIPLAGNVVSAVATGVDIFGNDGLIAAYKSCMAGTHP